MTGRGLDDRLVVTISKSNCPIAPAVPTKLIRIRTIFNDKEGDANEVGPPSLPPPKIEAKLLPNLLSNFYKNRNLFDICDKLHLNILAQKRDANEQGERAAKKALR